MTACAFHETWGCCPDPSCPFDHDDIIYEDDVVPIALGELPSAGRPPRPALKGKKARAQQKKNDNHRNPSKLWISPTSNTPITDFFLFSKPKGFEYNPLNAATDELHRLYDHMGWPSRNAPPERLRARKAFKAALVLQFGVCFGTELHDLRAWQALCQGIGFEEIPNTVRDCREMVESVYVNIIDLIDKMKSRKSKAHFTVRRFASAQELAEYSRNTNKLFPSYNGGGLLSFLMRHMNRPQRAAPGRARGQSVSQPSVYSGIPADIGDDNDIDNL